MSIPKNNQELIEHFKSEYDDLLTALTPEKAPLICQNINNLTAYLKSSCQLLKYQQTQMQKEELLAPVNQTADSKEPTASTEKEPTTSTEKTPESTVVKPTIVEQNGHPITLTEDPTESITEDGDVHPGRYQVKRSVIGAQIGNYRCPESIVRHLGLNDGDIVELQENTNPQSNSLPYIKLISASKKPNPNKYFKFGVVEERDGILLVDKNYAQEYLKIRGELYSFIIKQDVAQHYNITPGSIVDLAWSKPDDKESMQSIANRVKVVWVYPKEELPKISFSTAAKETYTKSESSKNKYQPRIDFDLKQANVLVVGYDAHIDALKEMIAAHNGITSSFDGHNLDNLNSKIQNAQIVLVVLGSTSHFAANNAAKLAKEAGIRFAFADKSSMLNFEQALFRALNDLPAFTSNTQNNNIDYPLAATD